jgi:hypothetical protein
MGSCFLDSAKNLTTLVQSIFIRNPTVTQVLDSMDFLQIMGRTFATPVPARRWGIAANRYAAGNNGSRVHEGGNGRIREGN